ARAVADRPRAQAKSSRLDRRMEFMARESTAIRSARRSCPRRQRHDPAEFLSFPEVGVVRGEQTGIVLKGERVVKGVEEMVAQLHGDATGSLKSRRVADRP